jgi:hypothetical protein
MSKRAFGRHLEMDLLEPLARAMVVALVIYGLLRIEVIHRNGAFTEIRALTYEGRMFLLEFGLGVVLPEQGAVVRQGEPLFTLSQGGTPLRFTAPLCGKVVKANADLRHDAGALLESPYDCGWVCQIKPADLANELSNLKIGKPAVAWYQDEIARLRKAQAEPAPEPGKLDMATFETQFLEPTPKV